MDEEPPFFLVQARQYGGKHIGPFTTRRDATLARTVADYDWNSNALIMDDKTLGHYLKAMAP